MLLGIVLASDLMACQDHVESYETVTGGTWPGAPKILESVSTVIYSWAVNGVLTVTPALKGDSGGLIVVTSI